MYMHGFSERSEPRENFEHFKYKVNFNKKKQISMATGMHILTKNGTKTIVSSCHTA